MLSPWVVFAATVAFFSAIVAVYWNASLAHFNDARYYVSMAEHPFHFTVSPWGFRILTPILVWLIHVPPVYGFAVVNVLSLATTAVLLYVYLLEFYTPRIAMFGLALFAISPAVLIELKWVVDVDAFFFAMVMLAFLALARRQWRLLGAALVLGVLDKETMLFVLLPLVVVGYIEYRFEPGKRWVVLIGLPILVYVLLHYTPIVFRPVPSSYDYLSLGNLRFVLHEQQQLAGGGAGYSFFWSMVDTFGALWIMAMLMLRYADRRIRHTAVFLVPVIGSVLLADNWSRVLALGFVVVIPLVCAAGLDRPFAAAVLMLTYDAMVSLGVKNVSGHAAYSIEIPLLLAAIGAALVMARAGVPRRVLATAPGGPVQPAATADSGSRPLREVKAASNGARQVGVTLVPARAQAQASVGAAASAEPRPDERVLIPALSAAARHSTTPEPPAPSRTQPRQVPRVAAATSAPPAVSTARVPAAASSATSLAPVARALRLPPASSASTTAKSTHRAPVTSAPRSRAESLRQAPPARAPQARREVPAPPLAAPAPRPERLAPPPPVASRPGTPGQEGGRSRLRAAPVPASPRPSRKAPAPAIPSPAPPRPAPRVPAPPASAPAPPATPRPARPVPPPARSEAVVHLETAETLLADVQRLVEAASAGSTSAATRR